MIVIEESAKPNMSTDSHHEEDDYDSEKDLLGSSPQDAFTEKRFDRGGSRPGLPWYTWLHIFINVIILGILVRLIIQKHELSESACNSQSSFYCEFI